MEQSQKTEDVERKLQELAARKPRPSSRIREIEETVEKWKEEPETLIQVKSIIAEKIADKSAYDQLLVMLSLLAGVLAASAPILGNLNKLAYGLALLVALSAPIIWMLMRSKSDYYSELQIIIEELCRQNDNSNKKSTSNLSY